jgi:flavin-dependent dehydrogenase
MNPSDYAVPTRVVIIGAGPAGLTEAYELCKDGVGSFPTASIRCTIGCRDSMVSTVAR